MRDPRRLPINFLSKTSEDIESLTNVLMTRTREIEALIQKKEQAPKYFGMPEFSSKDAFSFASAFKSIFPRKHELNIMLKICFGNRKIGTCSFHAFDRYEIHIQAFGDLFDPKLIVFRSSSSTFHVLRILSFSEKAIKTLNLFLNNIMAYLAPKWP